LNETVPCEGVAFYLRSGATYGQDFLGDVGSPGVEFSTVSVDDPVVAYLVEHGSVLVREELAPQLRPGHANAFRSLSAKHWDVVLPLRTERQLAGFICLGPKLSGDPYFQTDIDVLSAIAGQTGVALTNATLYQEVRDVRDHLESVLKNMESGVLAVTAERTITTANTVVTDLLGLRPSELIDRPLDTLPKVLAAPIERTLNDAVPTTQSEGELVTPHGSTPIVLSTSLLRDAQGLVRGAILVFSDHSKLKELDEEKRRSERLADFRNMAFGIAHEIKNPLVAIKTFAELVPERYEDKDFREDFLRIVVDEIERIDELVARLRGFGEPETRPLQHLSILDPLDDTLRLLQGEFVQRGIKTETDLQVNMPLIRGDFGQLKQLFLNLLLNAIESMNGGGVLTVVARVRSQRDGSSSAVLEFIDTGSGVPDSVSDRVFDPFVTTKPRGSGLGLSISRGIADAHRATIQIAARGEAEGTVVTVEFPAAST
jgi:two-component system, NtrC family, sensor histidine kinase AtoS